MLSADLAAARHRPAVIPDRDAAPPAAAAGAPLRVVVPLRPAEAAPVARDAAAVKSDFSFFRL
jgi:hypothetical protein